MAQYLMFKDTPVLKINDNYACEILDFAHLPHALRYWDVNYDDALDDAEIDLQYLYENLNQVGCLTSEDIYNFL